MSEPRRSLSSAARGVAARPRIDVRDAAGAHLRQRGRDTHVGCVPGRCDRFVFRAAPSGRRGGLAGNACCEPGFRRCTACGLCRGAADVRAHADGGSGGGSIRGLGVGPTAVFLEVVPLVTVVFAIVFHRLLLALLELHGVAGFLLFSILTGLLWGMVQEFLYRGWLQTELTRRFGAIVGLLVANVAFTFGPLHLNYLIGPGGVRWGGLAAVFGIGLFFGIVYYRSGNLWIPAVLHGLWPPNMT